MRKYWNLVFTFILLSFSNKDATGCELGELSLPQNDENPETRQAEIDTIAGQIQNELRLQEVDDIIYEMNYGPKLGASDLATALILKDLNFLNSRLDVTERPRAQEVGLIAFTSQINSVDDYTAMYDTIENAGLVEKPRVHGFDDDLDFGEDRLTMKFIRLSLVKDYVDLGLTDDQILEVCGGRNVQALFASKRFYMQDFSTAGNYNDQDASYKYVPSIIGYFCITDAEQFVPVAIHIVGGLKYSRFDSPNEWQLAKMALNAAGNEFQQLDHLVQSHMHFDPIKVALYRNVYCTHPIYNLLDHHLLQNFATAYVAFAAFMTQGEPFDLVTGWGAKGAAQFASDEFKKSTYRTLQEFIEENGLQKLRGISKYIDDAETYYKVIEKFVKTHLTRYYKDMKDIEDDTELQAWLSESSLYVDNFPSEVGSLQELVDVISDLIYQLTVRHHAISSDVVWHTLSFPYSQYGLFAPLPTSKGVDIELFDYMPPTNLMAPAVALASLFMGKLRDGDSMLNSEGVLSYEVNGVNLGMESHQALEKFQLALFDIDADIEMREQDNVRRFDILRPRLLPHYTWN